MTTRANEDREPGVDGVGSADEDGRPPATVCAYVAWDARTLHLRAAGLTREAATGAAVRSAVRLWSMLEAPTQTELVDLVARAPQVVEVTGTETERRTVAELLTRGYADDDWHGCQVRGVLVHALDSRLDVAALARRLADAEEHAERLEWFFALEHRLFANLG